MQKIAKFIYYRLLGWRFVGEFDRSVKKCVFVVAPHTSWHDFYIGILIRKIMDIQIDFVGKKELFKPPFGWYFRWVGGTAIDRTPGQNKVEAIAKIFETKDIFRLAMAPEGTREKTDRWKTGFYYIAKAANVPLVLVAFDFGDKAVKFSEPFYPTDNVDADLKKILSFYDGVKGKDPNKF